MTKSALPHSSALSVLKIDPAQYNVPKKRMGGIALQNSLFYGSGTALVTPFCGNRIDFDAMENLIDWQIDSGTDALIILGTTGEPCTISGSERSAVLECALARCGRRVPLIAGVGSNDTREAIRRAVEAQMLGADALLVVTPYYNRASRQGLIEHFTAIADKVDLPVIMYNVPSRTGVNLEPSTVAELAKHPNLCAVKDANSDLAHLTELARLCGDGIAIYCGNDDCILPAMALGARGVISVASNVIPSEIHALAMSWIKGDAKTCRELQLKWLSLIRLLFSEVSPIPVKAALSMMNRIEDTLRLPLTPMSPAPRELLRREMKRSGLIDG